MLSPFHHPVQGLSPYFYLPYAPLAFYFSESFMQLGLVFCLKFVFLISGVGRQRGCIWFMVLQWNWNLDLSFKKPQKNIHLFVYLFEFFYWGIVALLSPVRLFVTPWTIQSMEFSRPEYWSGQPFSSPGDLSNSGIKPRSPALHVDSLPDEPQGKPPQCWLVFALQQSKSVIHISSLFQIFFPFRSPEIIEQSSL